jgi:carboxymethylenebutenolidase
MHLSCVALSCALLVAPPGEIRVEKVQLPSGQDRVQAFRYRPAGAGPFPALLVLHGDFGLTPWVKDQARRLAEKGYVTLAVDLYRGELPQDIEEAHILERGLPEGRVLRDLRAATDYLEKQQDVNKNKIGIIGWDMGGGYALVGATRDRRLRAVVNCYGRLITDANALKGLDGAFLGIFAARDEGIPPETIERFKSAMKKAARRSAGLHVFADADNGFMDPQSPYRLGPPMPAAIAQAWRYIDEFLTRELKK